MLNGGMVPGGGKLIFIPGGKRGGAGLPGGGLANIPGGSGPRDELTTETLESDD